MFKKLAISFLLTLTTIIGLFLGNSQINAQTATSCEADINQNGTVDIFDYTLLSNDFFQSVISTPRSDINGDGAVNIFDYTILVNFFFDTCTIEPSPTPTLSPTPTPSPTVGAPYQAFTADSYWRQPIPANAPIDSNNSTYINYAMDGVNSDPTYLRLSGAPDQGPEHNRKWGYPIYWSDANDPVYTIEPSRYGPDIEIRIPLGAKQQEGSDAGIIIYDLAGGSVTEMWEASYNSSNDTWSASSTKYYELDSNGLSKRVDGADSTVNNGHRGEPPSIRTIRIDEVAYGKIEHRLECFWHATGRPNDSTEWFYWPMDNYEKDKGGITPEGLVIRIKHSINLDDRGLTPAARVIAQALQDYGCMIGDNEGGTKNSLKLETGYDRWVDLDAALSVDGLSSIPFSDYEFIEGGYLKP